MSENENETGEPATEEDFLKEIHTIQEIQKEMREVTAEREEIMAKFEEINVRKTRIATNLEQAFVRLRHMVRSEEKLS